MKWNLRFSHPSITCRHVWEKVLPTDKANLWSLLSSELHPSLSFWSNELVISKRDPGSELNDIVWTMMVRMMRGLVAVWATLHLEPSVSKNRTPNSREPPAVTTWHLERAKALIRSPAAAPVYWGRVQLSQL